MNPFVYIIVEGGAAQQVTTNIEGLHARVIDLDAARAGERVTSVLNTRSYANPLTPFTFPPDFLSDAERLRIHNEYDHASRAEVIEVLTDCVAHIPGATDALRAWLEGAEEETRMQDPDASVGPPPFPDHEYPIIIEGDPEWDA